MKKSASAVICASCAVLCWSTVATAFKIALQHLTQYEMLLIASITSLLVFSILSLLKKERRSAIFSLKPRQAAYFALIGLINPAVYYLVLFNAYNLLPAHIAQPVNYAWPVLLTLLSAIFLKQKIAPLKYLGMAISLSGVVVISISGSDDNNQFSFAGLFLAALSALIWAVYWILNQKKNHYFDSVTRLMFTFFFGTVYLFIGTLFVNVHMPDGIGLLSGVYVGLFEMAIPFLLFAAAQKNSHNPSLINQICYLSPFISMFLISNFLGENIQIITFGGLTLIVFGLIFNEYLIKKR